MAPDTTEPSDGPQQKPRLAALEAELASMKARIDQIDAESAEHWQYLLILSLQTNKLAAAKHQFKKDRALRKANLFLHQ